MRRALVVCLALSLSTTMLGVFLLFNIWKLNINICLLCSIALSLVCLLYTSRCV